MSGGWSRRGGAGCGPTDTTTELIMRDSTRRKKPLLQIFWLEEEAAEGSQVFSMILHQRRHATAAHQGVTSTTLIGC